MGPQLEKGYTRIADAILEKVAKTKLNGTQFRILMIVWRSTYGWQKKEHSLSIGYLSKATDINNRQVQRELNKLIDMNILKEIKAPTFNTSRVIGFNKNYVSIKQEVSNKPQVANKLRGSELDVSTGSELDVQNKELNKQYKDIYDYYISMNLIKHKKYSTTISNGIKAAVKEYDIETIKACIERHKKVVELTKNKGKYKVIARGLDTFLTEKTSNKIGSPLRYEEYVEGGKKYEAHFNTANVIEDTYKTRGVIPADPIRIKRVEKW